MLFKLLVLFVVTSAVTAADNCDCNTEKDKQDVWLYLKMLSLKADSTRDKNAYSVLPAVLSPLVGCDCKEKIRPKRKIITDVPRNKPVVVKHEKKSKKTIRHGDRKCPANYVRVGKYCIKEELLSE